MNLKWPENLSIYDMLYLELLAYREVEKIKQKRGCSSERHCEESEYFVCLRLLKYLLMAFLQVLTMHTVPVPLTCTIIFAVDSRFLERKVWGKEHEYVFTYWYKMKHSLFTFMSKNKATDILMLKYPSLSISCLLKKFCILFPAYFKEGSFVLSSTPITCPKMNRDLLETGIRDD